jgi:tetratricopeptide (TPR) repeat protein
VLVAGLDQAKFYYGAQASDATSLGVASELNPYDAALQVRLARANDRAGNQPARRAALEAAVQINPTYQPAQLSLAKLLIESGKYEEAYSHYQRMFMHVAPDVDSLVNFGVLAAQLDHPDEAVAAWQKALNLSPSQTNTHLYLADALARQRKFKEAIPHYEQYLALIAGQGNDATANQQLPGPEVILKVVFQLAETCRNAGENENALHFFTQGAALAHRFGDQRGLALAWIETAEIKTAQGKNSEALVHFQQALSLERSGNIPSQAGDWYSFAMFLKRTQSSPRLVFACLLKAEALITMSPNEESNSLIQPIREELRSSETALGATSTNAIRQDMDAALHEALSMKG